jgi:hypothetical protein
MRLHETPKPLTVSYDRLKLGACGAIAVGLVAAWTWRGAAALLAGGFTVKGALMPAIGLVVTAAFAYGIVGALRSLAPVLQVDEHGVHYHEAYGEAIPWSAIGDVRRRAGYALSFTVANGEHFGRKQTKSVQPATASGAHDVVTIKFGLLDSNPWRAEAAFKRFQVHHAEG